MFDAQKRPKRGIFWYVKSEKNVDRGPALYEAYIYIIGWGYLGRRSVKGPPTLLEGLRARNRAGPLGQLAHNFRRIN